MSDISAVCIFGIQCRLIQQYCPLWQGSHRRDLGSNYVRLTSEVVQYVEYVTNITIENEWLEQPPQVTNRNQLANGCKRIRIWF